MIGDCHPFQGLEDYKRGDFIEEKFWREPLLCFLTTHEVYRVGLQWHYLENLLCPLWVLRSTVVPDSHLRNPEVGEIGQ